MKKEKMKPKVTGANGAIFSPDGKYRYLLWRSWDIGGLFDRKEFTGPSLGFVLLNSSKAGVRINDPTVRRCVGFAKEMGYRRMYLGNLFGMVATYPMELMKVEDPVGPDNGYWLRWLWDHCGKVVAGWGVYGAYRGRGEAVRNELGVFHIFGLTKDGYPRHPLYLPKESKVFEWR